jgi:hypothetical protein
MSYPELIEVMEVRDAEVERRQEDDLLPGEVGKDMEWNYQRAPYELFADGALRRSV